MSCIPLYSCKRVSVDLELALKLNLYYRYLKKKKRDSLCNTHNCKGNGTHVFSGKCVRLDNNNNKKYA